MICAVQLVEAEPLAKFLTAIGCSDPFVGCQSPLPDVFESEVDCPTFASMSPHFYCDNKGRLKGL
jgi:hypothetical protein